MISKWEYKQVWNNGLELGQSPVYSSTDRAFIPWKPDEEIYVLNAMGKEGWELVSQGKYDVYREARLLTFKRPKT